MTFNFGSVNHLLPPSYKRMISAWLEEDCPSFDHGGFVVGEEVKEARLLGKSPVGLCNSSNIFLYFASVQYYWLFLDDFLHFCGVVKSISIASSFS